MKDKQSPHKIKVEKEIFWGKDRPLTWADIKHLELEDDDIIHSGWVDDENYDHHGYWRNTITRMVEETDEQFEKRLKRIESAKDSNRKMRYESYLRLKEEFENGK